MKTIEWNQSLAVGVPIIDQQHQTWIQRFNEVAAVLTTGQGPKRIADTLGFLIDHTHFHFSTEEKYMARHSYPGLEAHQARHEELRTTLANLEEDFAQEGATYILAEAIDNFLAKWLIDHIRQVDLKFGAFLKEKGIKISE